MDRLTPAKLRKLSGSLQPSWLIVEDKTLEEPNTAARCMSLAMQLIIRTIACTVLVDKFGYLGHRSCHRHPWCDAWYVAEQLCLTVGLWGTYAGASMEQLASTMISATPMQVHSMFSAALFPPLTLEALALRCGLLVLAGTAALAAYAWGAAVLAEVNRFIILSRHANRT